MTGAIRAPYINEESLKEIRLYRTVRCIQIDYTLTSISGILFYGVDVRPFAKLQAFNTVPDYENKKNLRTVPYGHEIVGLRCITRRHAMVVE